MPISSIKPDVLGVDSHTFKDLEIFESDTGDASLFEFCDRTRSIGGAAAIMGVRSTLWCEA